MKEPLIKAFNEQINKEYYSSYLYLAMAAYFEDIGMKGFANWMRVQSQEELTHVYKFVDFLTSRFARVELMQIEKPKFEWKNALDVFEETKKHEEYITDCINELVTLSLEHKDHAANAFLQWFVNEQVEEVANADEILQQIKMIGDNSGALYFLDKELGARVFTPPATTAEQGA